MDSPQSTESIRSRIGAQIGIVGSLLLLIGLGLGFGTLMFWLNFDTLPHWSAIDFDWHPPVTHSMRVDRVLAHLYGLHLGIVCFVAGLVLLIAGLKAVDS